MSARFEVTLTIDRQLQRRLLLVPAAALACGAVIILHLPLAPAWRALVALAWCGAQGWELYRFARNSTVFERLRFSARSLSGRRRGGQWEVLDLCGGTFVCRHFLWLRLQSSGGRRFDTLLLARRTSPADWRRLQLLISLRE